MRSRGLRVRFGILPLVLACPLVVMAEDKDVPAVASAEARNHVDETCRVELTVRSSKNAAPRREYYLGSEEDFHDEKNLALVISYDHIHQPL